MNASAPPKRMTTERLDRFNEAWRRCELDELWDYLTVDAVYSPICGEIVRGRDAVLRRFAEVMAEDVTSEVTFGPATVSGSLGSCRWRLKGRTPDGGTFEVVGVDLYEFDGDRIRSKDVYQKA